MVKEKSQVKSPEEEFLEKVTELKRTKTKEELLEIVSIQPFNFELRDFLAARKILDELKIEYPSTFKVQCEERKIEIIPEKIVEKSIEKTEEPKIPESPKKKQKKK